MLRKLKKQTQAETATKLGISLRTYSEYENLMTETRLTDYEFFKLADSISVSPASIWDELQPSAVCFWKQTFDFALWAKYIAEGKFAELKINGLPKSKENRTPLLELTKIYEKVREGKQDKDEMSLSEQLENHFKCQDIIEQLTSETYDFTVGPEPEVAGLLVMVVPTLKVESFVYVDEDNDEVKDFYSYKWSAAIRAMIDFEQLEPSTAPVQFNYITGDTSALDPLENNNYLEEQARALDARMNYDVAHDDDFSFEQEEELTEVTKEQEERNKSD